MIKKTNSNPRPDSPTSREKSRIAVLAALDKKADRPVLLNVRTLSSFADYFLICSGRSDRQVQSIADAVVESLKRIGRPPIGVEGHAEGRWVLIDCADVIVHVFHEPVREFYNLERLWHTAPRVSTAAWEEEAKLRPEERAPAG
jgi:ribosome-associated protein